MAMKKKKARVEFTHIPHSLTPGAKGVRRGKFFEMEFLKNFLDKYFNIKMIPSKHFVPEMVEVVDEELIVVPQFRKGYRIDFLLINPRNKRKVAIETRYKAVRGSDEQRFEHWFRKAELSRIPSILTFGGEGWTEKYIEMAKGTMNRFNWIVDVFNYEDEKMEMLKTIKSLLKIRKR